MTELKMFFIFKSQRLQSSSSINLRYRAKGIYLIRKGAAIQYYRGLVILVGGGHPHGSNQTALHTIYIQFIIPMTLFHMAFIQNKFVYSAKTFFKLFSIRRREGGGVRYYLLSFPFNLHLSLFIMYGRSKVEIKMKYDQISTFSKHGWRDTIFGQHETQTIHAASSNFRVVPPSSISCTFGCRKLWVKQCWVRIAFLKGFSYHTYRMSIKRLVQ